MINILFLEDDSADIELMRYHLRKTGILFEESIAASREEFLEKVVQSPDIILADYSLPQFTALDALKILQEKALDIPVVIVTGTISETIAVECMKMGAADYLLKDRLTRLGPAVEQVYAQHKLRKEKEITEQVLRERDALYRELVEMLPVAVYLYKDFKIAFANPAAVYQVGALSEDDLIGRGVKDLVHPDDFEVINQRIDQLKEYRNVGSTEMMINRLDGETIDVVVESKPIQLQDEWHVLTVAMEITEKKQREKELLTLVNLANDIRVATSDMDVLRCLRENLKKSIDISASGFMFFDSEQGEISKISLDGVWEKIPPEKFLEWTRDINSIVLENSIPYLGDFSKNDSTPLLKTYSPEIQAFVCIPVIAQHTRVGTFWLGKTSKFLDREIQLIIAISDMGANALNRIRSTEKLEQNFLETVLALAKTIELRDTLTGDHINRVSDLGMKTIQELGGTPEQIQDIQWGGLLHDIGKVAVPDHILLKPGALTADEWEIMRTHSEAGAQIVAPVSLLSNVAPIILSHHERWDGKGYPHQLAGEEIPLGARVIAVVDAYTAMIEDRVYRKGIEPSEALRELVRCKGKQFDPAVVDAFINSISP